MTRKMTGREDDLAFVMRARQMEVFPDTIDSLAIAVVNTTIHDVINFADPTAFMSEETEYNVQLIVDDAVNGWEGHWLWLALAEIHPDWMDEFLVRSKIITRAELEAHRVNPYRSRLKPQRPELNLSRRGSYPSLKAIRALYTR